MLEQPTEAPHTLWQISGSTQPTSSTNKEENKGGAETNNNLVYIKWDKTPQMCYLQLPTPLTWIESVNKRKNGIIFPT